MPLVSFTLPPILNPRRRVPWIAALLLGAAGAVQAQGACAPAGQCDLLVNHDAFQVGAAVEDATNVDGPVGGTFVYRTKAKINGAAGSVPKAVLTQRLPTDAIFQGFGPFPAGVTVNCFGAPTVGQPIGVAVITCEIEPLETTEVPIDFRVILPNESTDQKAYASITAPGNTDNGTGNDNLIARNITTYKRADLAVEIKDPANGSNHLEGSVVVYDIEVRNTNSPYAFELKAGEKAVVRFNEPPGTEFHGSHTGSDWQCQQGVDNGKNYTECTYTAPVGGRSPNTTLPELKIPVKVTSPTGNSDATATVTGKTTADVAFMDADTSNNKDEVQINFQPNTSLDMVLAKSVDTPVLDKDAPTSPAPVIYTLKSTRTPGSGVLPQKPIVITDTLPDHVGYTSGPTQVNGDDWDCGHVGRDITCTFVGTIPSTGDLPDLTFQAAVDVAGVTVGANGTALLSNQAKLTVANEVPGANNEAKADITVSDQASLATSKGAYLTETAVNGESALSVIANGQEFYYRVGVTNNGQVDIVANTITVTDVLDAKLEYKGPVAPALANGWSCTVAPLPWAGTAQTVTCTLTTTLAKDASNPLPIKVQAHTANPFATIAANTASVACPTGRTCVNGTEWLANSPKIELSEKKADLSIQKSAAITQDAYTTRWAVTPPPTPPAVNNPSGAEVEYTLLVRNAVPVQVPPLLPADFQTAGTVVVRDTVTNLLSTDSAASPLPPHAVTGAPRYASTGRFVEAVVDTSNFYGGDSSAVPPVPPMTSEGCTYTVSGSNVIVECTLKNVPVGNTDYKITIRARQFVNPTSSSQENTFKNTATVSSPDTAEFDGGNNSDDADVKLKALTNLRATKTANPKTALAGQPITYTLAAYNDGPSQATDVKVVDILPEGMIWVTAPNMPTTGANRGACTLANNEPIVPGLVVTAANREMTCAWTTAAGVGNRSLNYTLRSASVGYPTAPVDNNVYVDTATQETIPLNDPATDNRDNEQITLSAPQLNVLVNMGHSADGLPLGGETTYTISAANSGASTSYATNVVLEDMFHAPGSTAVFDPSDLAVDSVTTSTGSTRFSPSDCTLSATGLRCEFDWLAPGEEVSVKFRMKAASINNGSIPVGTIRHEARVSADGEQLNGQDVTQDNFTTDRTSTYDPAAVNPADLRDVDLSIQKTTPNLATGATVAVGEVINYRLTVKNEEDPAPAMPAQPKHLVNGNAKVVDVLPSGLELVLPLPTGSNGSVCTYAAPRLECTITALNAGTSEVFNFQVRVNSVPQGQTAIRNAANVTSLGDPVDPNNEDGIDVPVENIDVGLVKSVDRTRASVGNTLTYTLAVTNNGSASNSAAVITDTLPAGVTFAASASGCTAAGSTVTCNVGALAVSQTKTFTFTVTVDASVAPGTRLLNTASVTTPGDRDPTNNEDDAETEVVAPQAIPTLSEWALIALSMLLAAFALRRMPLQPGRRM